MSKQTYITLYLLLNLLTCKLSFAESINITDEQWTQSLLRVKAQPSPKPSRSGDSVMAMWDVVSNGRFSYSFSGRSWGDKGTLLSFPRFHKQDMTAWGTTLPHRYDHLDTSAGLAVFHYRPFKNTEIWAGGHKALGTVEDLIKPSTDIDSPFQSTKTSQVPGKLNEAYIALWLKGIADKTDQSGLYQTNVMMTVTAEEN